MLVTGAKMHDARSSEQHHSPFRAWFLVFVIFLIYIVGQIDRNVMAMLVEEMKRDLHFSDEKIGILMGFGFSLTYAVSAIFIGHVSDRTSRKKILATGLAVWSLLTALCGLTKNFSGLLVARLGVGMGEATITPTALPMVADAFPPERRAFPIAVCIAGSSAGHSISPILIGFIIYSTVGMSFGPYPLVGTIYGWQLSFFIAGIIGLMIFVLLLFVDEPKKETTGDEALTMAEVFAHFFRHPRFYAYLFFAVPLMSTVSYGLIAWLPAYLARTFPLDSLEIGTLMGTGFMPAAVISPIIAGYIGRYTARSQNPRAHINVILLLIPLGGCLVTLPMIVPNVMTCIITFSAAVVFTNIWVTFGFINIQQVVQPRYRSQCTAILMAALILVGSGLGPMIVGSITTRWVGEDSLGTAMLLTLAITLPLSLLLALAARFDRKQHPQIYQAAAK